MSYMPRPATDTRYVNANGDIMTGTLETTYLTTPFVSIDRAAGSASNVEMKSGGSLRWTIGKNSDAESGSDAGSNFSVASWTDAGAWKANPVNINRQTGLVTLAGLPTASGHAATKQYVDDKIVIQTGAAPTNPETELWVDPNAVPPAGTDATWKIPTLTNGWSMYSAPWGNVVGYRKLSTGLVIIKGLLTGGTVGQGVAIFTLPVGYRPTENQLFSVVGNNAFARLDVQSNGAVCANAGSNSYFSCNVAFYAEQ